MNYHSFVYCLFNGLIIKYLSRWYFECKANTNSQAPTVQAPPKVEEEGANVSTGNGDVAHHAPMLQVRLMSFTIFTVLFWLFIFLEYPLTYRQLNLKQYPLRHFAHTTKRKFKKYLTMEWMENIFCAKNLNEICDENEGWGIFCDVQWGHSRHGMNWKYWINVFFYYFFIFFFSMILLQVILGVVSRKMISPI